MIPLQRIISEETPTFERLPSQGNPSSDLASFLTKLLVNTGLGKADYIYTVTRCPKGYPQLAALLSSEENVMIYRKFSYLQSRILLHRQDELRELERDLDRLDRVHERKFPVLLRCREKDDARPTPNRKEIPDDIAMKFREYCE